MKNQTIPCRLYHFHKDRVIRANVNDCPAVNKEKTPPKTVTKKRKMLKSQDFSVEIYCNMPQFVL